MMGMICQLNGMNSDKNNMKFAESKKFEILIETDFVTDLTQIETFHFDIKIQKRSLSVLQSKAIYGLQRH